MAAMTLQQTMMNQLQRMVWTMVMMNPIKLIEDNVDESGVGTLLLLLVCLSTTCIC